ncbi:MAG TPA: photosystem II S4 domain protein [Synechococcales bacterium UBA10510]|nr:photosystem II S4 domain protein [Synechococcales bacterium UBA10510]
MLPRHELLRGSRHPQLLEPLIASAETVLRTWQPQWTAFLGGALREEAEACLGQLSELTLHSDGGYPGAERRRLLLQRRESSQEPSQLAGELVGELPVDLAGELTGLEISGNFLFDPAEADDLRQALWAAGAAAADLGDVWRLGDRGGQAIVTSDLAQRLDGCQTNVRSVEVRLEARPLADLQLPAVRNPKRLNTVEASLRLDAVASAGFGLSRARMAELIRQGEVRINWRSVSSPSKELAVGDRVQLAGRGELELEQMTITKRDRWRLTLLRR